MVNRIVFILTFFAVTLCFGICFGDVDVISEPYLLDTGLLSRSISFENPTGAPGQGGKAASKLGVGRKGSPAITLNAGQDVQLCDIEGPGTIRHIWMTTNNDPLILRSLVLRAWWDGQSHPSIECPIGDFMGSAHGKVMPYQSAVHSLGRNAGMNIWLPMPFTKSAKITLTNEGEKNVPLFYQIDYTIKDKHPNNVGRLHVLFRRENPTKLKRDFELLPQRKNKGRFIGSLIGIRNLTPGQWWGEGEVKVYMDGDTEFPTICGTGSEDYVGLSWGIQQTPYWRKECRITIQQIAWRNGLAETQDDWSCATFWYEPVPSAPLPELPDVTLRTVNIWPGKETVKLFNGKDLTGWETSGDAKWVVENGMLIGTQGENNSPGDLFTKEHKAKTTHQAIYLQRKHTKISWQP